MMREMSVSHEFVEFVPEDPEFGKVYVSVEYATVVHKCCCGCGNQVVTPLSPAGWTLSFDGVSISLSPSIGNWSFPCQSHYFIRRNRIVWSGSWSREEIQAGRSKDSRAAEAYHDRSQAPKNDDKGQTTDERDAGGHKTGAWHWLMSWFWPK